MAPPLQPVRAGVLTTQRPSFYGTRRTGLAQVPTAAEGWAVDTGGTALADLRAGVAEGAIAGRLSMGRPLKPRSSPAHPARDTCSGGTRARQGMACSSAWASCSTTWSCAGGAATCTPTGMPLLCQASGSEIAGVPIRL